MFSAGTLLADVSLPCSADIFVPSTLAPGNPRMYLRRMHPSVGRVGSHLPGHVPGVHQAHDLVPEIGGGPEHQRAAAVDHGDAVGPAVAGGGGRDAADMVPRSAGT